MHFKSQTVLFFCFFKTFFMFIVQTSMILICNDGLMSILVCDPVMKVVNVKAEYNIIEMKLTLSFFCLCFQRWLSLRRYPRSPSCIRSRRGWRCSTAQLDSALTPNIWTTSCFAWGYWQLWGPKRLNPPSESWWLPPITQRWEMHPSFTVPNQ